MPMMAGMTALPFPTAMPPIPGMTMGRGMIPFGRGVPLQHSPHPSHPNPPNIPSPSEHSDSNFSNTKPQT